MIQISTTVSKEFAESLIRTLLLVAESKIASFEIQETTKDKLAMIQQVSEALEVVRQIEIDLQDLED